MKKYLALTVLLTIVLCAWAGAKEVVVTSKADSGQGTFRWALETARSGDTITFDVRIFPPNNPATIDVHRVLPSITQGNLTIDASNAGVILDGERIRESDVWGLEVISNGNRIYGLQIINFPGPGIQIVWGAQYNTIGGDRTVGTGMLGQGNLCSGNNGGICLWDEGTSYNTITGNLIGTDVTGTEPFGNIDGMFLSHGASHNTIGPDNVVAYNREHAIVIQGPNSLGNTITQNSIHTNGWGGIQLLDGGNSSLSSPLMTDFDVVEGYAAGNTCPSCRVEIFSDSGSQGAIYEGQTIADEMGAFLFEKGASFRGPHLTATATSPDSNTSVFSAPTIGTGRSRIIQKGNRLPKTELQTKPSRELKGNRITTGLWSGLWQPHDYQEILKTGILELGSKRVILAVNSIDRVTVNWNEPEFPIARKYDDWITSIAENGVTITYVLSFWDKEGHARGNPGPCQRFTSEDDIARYLEFVRYIVHHFKDRVQYFELWNEPNVSDCGQRIEIEDYINLVRRAVPVIREEDPEAKVVIGAVTSLVDCGGHDYLFGILNSDVLPLVDAISWHVGAPSLEYEYWRELYIRYPSIVQEIKEVASAHGFTGEYIADELNWRSPLNPFEAEPWIYSPIVAAKYYARGMVMNLGMNLTVGVAGLSSARPQVFSTVRNLCTIMDGTETLMIPAEIQMDAKRVAHYGFALPNGDKLFAIWTDGVAQDEDPGVPATITFPGLTAKKIVGIDVLHGFEQELVFETGDDSTVIRNLLIKDYPILIRLSDMTMGPDYEETVGDGLRRLGEPGAGPASDRDGDGVPDDEDYCPDWPGDPSTNGC